MLFFIYFSQLFVYMNTDLQPNLQYITYDIIHMFMGEKNINKMLFSYIENMSLLKTITKCRLGEKRFSLYINVPRK